MSEKMTAADAKAVIDAANQERLKACHADIINVCEKHRCVLVAVPGVVPAQGGGFVLSAEIKVKTLDEHRETS